MITVLWKKRMHTVESAPEFNALHLDAFLREAISGLEGPMTLERVSGGQSNPTFFVSFANRRLVLRKKPAGEILPSAHAVDREFRILNALAATELPVPKTVLFHGESDIVGTPFYLTERIEGRVKFLRDQAAFSTITVRFEAKPTEQVGTTAVRLPVSWLYDLNLPRLLRLNP